MPKGARKSLTKRGYLIVGRSVRERLKSKVLKRLKAGEKGPEMWNKLVHTHRSKQKEYNSKRIPS